MPQTPNHGYDVPEAGAENWHRPLNRNFERFDADVEIRDHARNRENYAPKSGAKFLATDTGDAFVGDGQQWSLLATAAGSGPTGISRDVPRPAMPAYAELTDSQGNAIEGSVGIAGREGTVEVLAFDHDVRVPYDPASGDVTGEHRHGPVTIVKEIDKASPLLYRALSGGETLQNVTVRWYRIDETGAETEYFSHVLERVTVASVESFGSGPQEAVAFLYETITWRHTDGSIEHTDSWIAAR